MPKMKTNHAAKKRFRVSPSGKIKCAKAFKNHILTKKSQKRKRNLRMGRYVDPSNLSRVKKMLNI